MVLRVLQPIWTSKTETAVRLRGRLERVLDWAKAQGYREGENPAAWRGHLDKLLAEPRKVAKREHHAALPWQEIGAFMRDVRAMPGASALALEIIILTAARTSEVLNARWAEFDLDAALWTVPAARMKAHKEHRVPLSDAAVAALRKALADAEESEYLFPSRKGAPLSNMACLKLLERMGRADLTVHGFRSTFRDWCSEATDYPRDVAEMALAHTIESKVESAYRRGDLLEKRRALMADWAVYCDTVRTAGDVVPLRGKKAA
jgi:integrase